MGSRIAWLLLALATASATAGEANVAVAANFAGSAKKLAAEFERTSGHRLLLSAGSTGKLYAQIRNQAPFDVFLSADDETPQRMEQEGWVVPGTRLTYAIGKVILWSSKSRFVDSNGDVLRQGRFKRLAIANPKLAPYGAAAQQAMERIGVWSLVQDRLVLGENIAQALHFVASGNAELGFVALSQIQQGGSGVSGGSHWVVPRSLHDPIRQDAALLARAGGNAAARQFLDFLRSPSAREQIRADGYDLP